MAKSGLNPRFTARQEVPTFEELSKQVHIDRLPTWKNAKRLAQRIKAVLDVARAKGFREGENPVTAIREAKVLPAVKAKVTHHEAMPWRDVPAVYAELSARTATAAVG